MTDELWETTRKQVAQSLGRQAAKEQPLLELFRRHPGALPDPPTRWQRIRRAPRRFYINRVMPVRHALCCREECDW